MADECIFCKIASGDIPVDAVYEDDEFIAFPDVNPQAPVHVLVIPRRHYDNLVQATETDPGLFSRIFKVITKVAEDKGLMPEGFRLVVNTGPQGGQTVNHLHFHVIGGRFMAWPPG